MVAPDSYKRWTTAAQEKALAELQARQNSEWRPFYCPDATCNGRPHPQWEWEHARVDQRPPTDPDWLTWLLIAGAEGAPAGSDRPHGTGPAGRDGGGRVRSAGDSPTWVSAGL